uniref:M15 family metallopeptidase n=1 Tax=uncultured Acinetobacter sp. TaxID=165433 RepID=UPI002631509C|nr:M15 family metallopeptidase [uncultured Acinetobacter sp.]
MSQAKYILSKRSLSNLEGVHPDLVRVVKRAITLTKQDFMVIEGVRSREQCMINYGKGRTVAQCQAKGIPAKYAKPKLAKVTWLNNPFSSRHVTGHAVDLVPYPVDWNDLKKFDAMADAMLVAADLEGVSIRWGADWDSDGNRRERGEYDSPHFEL